MIQLVSFNGAAFEVFAKVFLVSASAKMFYLIKK